MGMKCSSFGIRFVRKGGLTENQNLVDARYSSDAESLNFGTLSKSSCHSYNEESSSLRTMAHD